MRGLSTVFIMGGRYERRTGKKLLDGIVIPFHANVSTYGLCYYDRRHFSEHGLTKKKSSTPTPHDATFRQFLTQPDITRI